MGIDLVPEFAYKFIYKAHLDGNLIEHEYDHVFIGSFDGTPMINEEEVEEWRYSSLNILKQDALMYPNLYTYWLKIILSQKEFEKAYSKERG